MKTTSVTNLKFEILNAGIAGINMIVDNWLSEQRAKKNEINIVDIGYSITAPGEKIICCFILYEEL